MKTLWFAALLLAGGSSARAAETAITLNFNRVMVSSTEKSAAMIDLTGEIKRQSPATKLAGQRIKSVEVDGEASFLGATVILMVSGQAVDSMSEEAGAQEAMILKSAFPKTPGPWMLGIRGQFALQRVVITIDNDDTSAPAVPLDPMVRNDVNTQVASENQAVIDNGPAVVFPATPAQPGQQSVNADFAPGESLIAVSDGSGLIDYVIFVGQDGPDSYTVDYEGSYIPTWSRKQLAKTSGCSGDLCVGTKMNRLGDNITIVGLLPGDRFVVQKSNEKFLVVNRVNLAAKPTPAAALPAAPVKPATPYRVGRYQTGQKAYYVPSAQNVVATTIQGIQPNGSVDLKLPNGTVRNVSRSEQIAVIYGCNRDGFCVGDQVQTVSGNGRLYYGRIVAIQSNDFAVLTLQGMNGLVGFWPFQSLEK